MNLRRKWRARGTSGHKTISAGKHQRRRAIRPLAFEPLETRALLSGHPLILPNGHLPHGYLQIFGYLNPGGSSQTSNPQNSSPSNSYPTNPPPPSPPPPTAMSAGAIVLDDSSASFSSRGWRTVAGGFDGSEHFAAAGNGTAQATWSFAGLAAGEYEVYATWNSFFSRGTASDAPFTLYNGSTAVAAAAVNQKLAPSGPVLDGSTFQLLGTVNLTSNTFDVSLDNAAIGDVLADAIAVVPVFDGDHCG
jgi:hypothetical protein